MKTAITEISGIGPGTAKILMENGFASLQEIADTSIDKLAAVPGFGPVRAGRVIKAANEVISAAADTNAKATEQGELKEAKARKAAAKKEAKAKKAAAKKAAAKEKAKAKKKARSKARKNKK